MSLIAHGSVVLGTAVIVDAFPDASPRPASPAVLQWILVPAPPSPSSSSSLTTPGAQATANGHNSVPAAPPRAAVPPAGKKKPRAVARRESPATTAPSHTAPYATRAPPAEAVPASCGAKTADTAPVDEDADPGNSAQRSPSAGHQALGDGVDMGSYFGDVARRIARVQRYPDDARSHGWEGVATLAVTICRDGRLCKPLRMLRSSGFASLDRAAAGQVQTAAPFPPLPQGAAYDTVVVNVPIRFVLAR